MHDWRELPAEVRETYVEYVRQFVATRFGPDSVGRKQYGDTFQGDPLAQLAEEQADGLFYALVAKAERDALLERLATVTSKLEAQAKEGAK